MSTWYGDPPPPPRPVGWRRVRVLLRGAAAIALLGAGLLLVVLLRGPERMRYGLRRPWTGRVARVVMALVVPVLGLRLRRAGAPMRHPGALVANHASWLDIFALNACLPVQFVSKAEVAHWPGIGVLARAAGTLFIRRDPREAQAQQRAIEDRIRAGQRLVFFPEGTSSDGRRVLPFKSTLFQAFFTDGLAAAMWLQPVSILYHAPRGADPRFYGWWGDMGFGPHLAQVLAWPGGTVELRFHPPLRVLDYPSRKALAAACEAAVRAGVDQLLSR